MMERTPIEQRTNELDMKRRNAEVRLEHIWRIAAENEELLTEIFAPEETDRNTVSEILFRETEKAIDWATTEVLRAVGIVYSQLPNNSSELTTNPYVRLGWARYIRMFDKVKEEGATECFMLSPTHDFIERIDQMRAEQGFVDLATQARLNREPVFNDNQRFKTFIQT